MSRAIRTGAISAILFLIPTLSFAEEPIEPSRHGWVAGFEMGFGSNWLTANDVTEGGSLAATVDVHLGRGVTNNLLVTGILGRRSAWNPDATSSETMMTSYALAGTLFPFEGSGAFVQLGAGFTATDEFTLKLGMADGERITFDSKKGFLALAAVGHEWRVGSGLGLDFLLSGELHQFDESIDRLTMVVAALRLRWYM